MSYDLRKAAEMVVEVLEDLRGADTGYDIGDTVRCLRAALAEQDAEQKPAAWIREDTVITTDAYQASCWRDAHIVTPLYIAPPRRAWVGLTDEERRDVLRRCFDEDDVTHDDGVLISAIEAALKEKNHG